MDNTVRLFMSPKKVRFSRPLYQYDEQQYLIITGFDLYEPDEVCVDFGLSEDGYCERIGPNENGFPIPDSILKAGLPIHVWLVFGTEIEDEPIPARDAKHGEGYYYTYYKTVAHGIIPVIKRPEYQPIKSAKSEKGA